MSTDERLGVAVIGTGFGCITHVRALTAAGFDVRALVGRDPVKTQARAERFGIPYALTSVENALGLSGVDAVTVATPPDTHAEIAGRAIAAGKHVLCEKPLTRDTREAEALLAAAEEAGVVHLLGAEFRWAPAQATMATAIAEGRIGSPRLASFVLHIPLLADPGAVVPGWWTEAGSSGGWLGAYASHVIDQIRSTLGEFAAVSACLTNVVERSWTAEDSYSVQFRLDTGVSGVMQSSSSDWGPILILTRVVGSTGTIWAEGDNVGVADRDGTHQLAPAFGFDPTPPDPAPSELFTTHYEMLHSIGQDMGPWTRMATVFRDLILGGDPGRAAPDVGPAVGPPPATFADGVALMRVLDAIRASAATGDWVDC